MQTIFIKCLNSVIFCFISVFLLETIFAIILALKSSKNIIFIHDIFFLVNFSACNVLIHYYQNDGMYRWFYILSQIIGIYIFYKTIFKIIRKFIDSFVFTLKKKIKKD